MKTFIYKYDMKTFEQKGFEEQIADKENFIAVYDGDLPTGNIRIGNQFYRWCSKRKYGNNFYFFVAPYTINKEPLKELENRTNPICPVCNGVEYDGWERDEGKYKCPFCYSDLILEHQYILDYGGGGTSYHRVTLQKVFKPKKIKVSFEVQND